MPEATQKDQQSNRLESQGFYYKRMQIEITNKKHNHLEATPPIGERGA